MEEIARKSLKRRQDLHNQPHTHDDNATVSISDLSVSLRRRFTCFTWVIIQKHQRGNDCAEDSLQRYLQSSGLGTSTYTEAYYKNYDDDSLQKLHTRYVTKLPAKSRAGNRITHLQKKKIHTKMRSTHIYSNFYFLIVK